jgi:hypothetical protein
VILWNDKIENMFSTGHWQLLQLWQTVRQTAHSSVGRFSNRKIVVFIVAGIKLYS